MCGIPFEHTTLFKYYIFQCISASMQLNAFLLTLVLISLIISIKWIHENILWWRCTISLLWWSGFGRNLKKLIKLFVYILPIWNRKFFQEIKNSFIILDYNLTTNFIHISFAVKAWLSNKNRDIQTFSYNIDISKTTYLTDRYLNLFEEIICSYQTSLLYPFIFPNPNLPIVSTFFTRRLLLACFYFLKISKGINFHHYSHRCRSTSSLGYFTKVKTKIFLLLFLNTQTLTLL